MTVDFTKKAHILAVHGVQLGENDDIDSDVKIRKLVDKTLALSHLSREFEVKQYLYEDINDDAQKFYQGIARTIRAGQPLAGAALQTAIDLIGDVVTASAGTSTAAKIRRGLREEILRSYDEGHKLIVIAHSLGTLYALDVLSELMSSNDHFMGDDRKSWPMLGLITMGSPLGLEFSLGSAKVFDRRPINPLQGADYRAFPWHNFYNVLDPVVTGNVFGSPVEVVGSRGPVETRYGEETAASKWLLQGHKSASGKQWLLAHTAYWKNPKIGGKLVDLLWG